MAKPKNVMISQDLFIDLCKFFLVGEEYADYDVICKALSAKIDSLSEREAYAKRLQQERASNSRVEAPAAADKPHLLSGPLVDLEWSDAPGRCNILEHGTRNVLGQHDTLKAYQVFEAVNAGELEPTPENCGDSYIIL
jgi:hypothetical protein